MAPGERVSAPPQRCTHRQAVDGVAGASYNAISRVWWMLRTFARLGAAGLALPASLLIGRADAQMAESQIRAANLARMVSERINAGLSRYFTANCMHQRGGGSCLVNSGPKGYLFLFLGGPPGWEVLKQAATLQTRILISPDGSQVVTVEYNGVPR